VATAAPDAGWVVDPGSSIDLDVVTSNTAPVIAEAFVTYFAPPTLQVPRSGSPLTPSFTGINAKLYATDKGAIIPFTDAQTDTGAGFTNSTWRIGNSSTTGYGDISYTNLTVGSPTDAGDYAQWPAPTAMSNSPAFITVPIRYKNSSGIVTQASVAVCQLLFSDPGATGSAGSSVDISGYTSFVQNSGGAFTPTNATLSALLQNITSPTYSWSISGATPTSSTSSSVVVTPTSSSTGVTVTLTVNGSNLLSPISKTIQMPVVYDGAPGSAGANGVMSAFPTIYIWTGSSTPPTRPTTTSTYTWASGSYSAPTSWYTQAPSNTTPGNYLWSITVPLTVSATTTTSTLDWTNVTYPIRAIAFNGNNGTNGSNGSNGTNGTNGSATFVVTRVANDSSAPTNAEVNAIVGRNPVSGDICTVSYNSYNNAVVYQYITSWSLFQTYITGSLIVQNTITADKLATNFVYTQNLKVGSSPAISGTTMTGSGALINSDGTFALGTASGNVTYNGTKLSINGIGVSSVISGGTITTINPGTWYSFGTATLKKGLCQFSSNIYYASRVDLASSGSTAPASGDVTYSLRLIDSSSTVIYSTSNEVLFPCFKQASAVQTRTLNDSAIFGSFNVPADGTYTMQAQINVDGFGTAYEFYYSSTGSPMTINTYGGAYPRFLERSLGGYLQFYQPGIQS
jgi:hypothetical protein